MQHNLSGSKKLYKIYPFSRINVLTEFNRINIILRFMHEMDPDGVNMRRRNSRTIIWDQIL
jgi:hypothetical protein